MLNKARFAPYPGSADSTSIGNLGIVPSGPLTSPQHGKAVTADLSSSQVVQNQPRGAAMPNLRHLAARSHIRSAFDNRNKATNSNGYNSLPTATNEDGTGRNLTEEHSDIVSHPRETEEGPMELDIPSPG